MWRSRCRTSRKPCRSTATPSAAGLVEELPYGFLHFGFVVSDVDAAASKLSEADVPFVMEPTTFGDLRIAFFEDPAGTRIELIER